MTISDYFKANAPTFPNILQYPHGDELCFGAAVFLKDKKSQSLYKRICIVKQNSNRDLNRQDLLRMLRLDCERAQKYGIASPEIDILTPKNP